MECFHPGHHAADSQRRAVVMGTGEVVTYAQLEERSRRLAGVLHARGLKVGDHIGVVVSNTSNAHAIMWAAQRSGLYFTPINSHSTPDEAAYILQDCGARAVIVVATANCADLARGLKERAPQVGCWIAAGGAIAGYEQYEALIETPLAGTPPSPREGAPMTYSSGTTGRPKGVLRALANWEYGTRNLLDRYFQHVGVDARSVFLVPMPLYHAMPMHWSMALHRIGATCVLMERFDAQRCLELIQEQRVTHGLFVPTMFVRMLKLPESQRAGYDLSSLRKVIHAAAPCPVEIKRRMLEWWGPVIDELYGASEGGGQTYITAEQWLAHPGSVGVPFSGQPHVCDDTGKELPAGEPGVIWFEGTNTIAFHNQPELTASVVNDRGWVTFWDVGYLDSDGYLYLTDRKQLMIIRGGVNIHPQEVENAVALHPKVARCAVFGVPHEELGEVVKAVVQSAEGVQPGPELEAELIRYWRSVLAPYKCPSSVEFGQIPGDDDTAKIYRRQLRDRYWPDQSRRPA